MNTNNSKTKTKNFKGYKLQPADPHSNRRSLGNNNNNKNKYNNKKNKLYATRKSNSQDLIDK